MYSRARLAKRQHRRFAAPFRIFQRYIAHLNHGEAVQTDAKASDRDLPVKRRRCGTLCQ